MNGKSAQTAVIGAFVLLAMMIVAMTFIVTSKNEIPQEFSAIISALTGAIGGFLVGTRVVTPDVSAHIKTEALNKEEIAILTKDNQHE